MAVLFPDMAEKFQKHSQNPYDQAVLTRKYQFGSLFLSEAKKSAKNDSRGFY
jgi:hypothetical protein